MQPIYIVGVAMTPFGRFLDRSLRDTAEEAVQGALEDAGVGYEDIQTISFANAVQGAMEGQFGIRGQAALARLPFGTTPVTNVENACASASTALQVAISQVRAGEADIALAVGAEKMVSENSQLSMDAFHGSWDRARQEETLAGLREMAAATEVPAEVAGKEGARTIFMDVYAAFARYHMGRFGTTQEQIAAVAAKNHCHSVENPLSQYRKPFTIEEVLDARLIAWPFTLPMCSPISDGAAAAVVCSEAAARRLGMSRAVRVRSTALMTGGRRDYQDVEQHISRQAAQRAYDLAGVGPEDIDLVECHDATAFGEIQQSENLGFFPLGEGGPAALRGDTTIGGRIPFNPSGGLESKGHPIGATGLGQIYELVTQLRGDAGARQVGTPRLALQENGGGLMKNEEAAVFISILERAQ